LSKCTKCDKREIQDLFRIDEPRRSLPNIAPPAEVTQPGREIPRRPSRASGTEAQFATEMIIFSGPENLNNPRGVDIRERVGGVRLVAVLNSGKQVGVARSSDGQQRSFDVSGENAGRRLRQAPASAG